MTQRIRFEKLSRLALSLFLVGACSGRDAPASATTAGNGGAAHTNSGGSGGSDGSTGGSEEGCPDAPLPELEQGEGCVQVGTLTGMVVDEKGQPPSNPTITVCGAACFVGELDADGTFEMPVDYCYTQGKIYKTPVFIYHGWPDYADVTVKIVPDGTTELPATLDVGRITTVSTASMDKFDYDEPVAATFSDASGFTVEVADCAVKLPAFEYDVYVGDASVESFPLPGGPPDLLALYFVGPDNTYLAQPALVRFPNTTQLSAGTPVELLALGNMGTTTVIEAGTFDVIGSGRVSDDGDSVVSDPVQDSAGSGRSAGSATARSPSQGCRARSLCPLHEY